jgi:hypothetical protein
MIAVEIPTRRTHRVREPGARNTLGVRDRSGIGKTGPGARLPVGSPLLRLVQLAAWADHDRAGGAE